LLRRSRSNVYYLIEGRARVQEDGLYGFTDENGDLVIEAQYDYATSFENELAAVKEGGKISIIDRQGTRVTEPLELEVDSREMNLDYHFLDRDGWIIKP